MQVVLNDTSDLGDQGGLGSLWTLDTNLLALPLAHPVPGPVFLTGTLGGTRVKGTNDRRMARKGSARPSPLKNRFGLPGALLRKNILATLRGFAPWTSWLRG